MHFDMTTYMKECKHLHPHFFPDQPFYPEVNVHFTVTPSQVRVAAHGGVLTKLHLHIELQLQTIIVFIKL